MIGGRRVAAALVVLAAGGTATSGASYTASSNNPQVFGSAGDFGVHVTMTDPGSPLRGTVGLGATASETAGGTIASVAIDRAPAGTGTWTQVCTDNLTPFTCSLDTTTLSNGQYDFRARATNNNGYTRTSATITGRLVDNAAPTVTMTDPGAWFAGTIALSSTAADTGGSGLADVRYEYKASALGVWLPACTGVLIILPCDFLTNLLVNGTSYDFRAIATDGAGNVTTSTAVTNRRVDNGSPSGTVTDPGAALRGTVTVNAAPADAHSGVASIRIQRSPAGTGTWTDICTDTAAAWSCSWDTTTVTGGLYDLRMIVTDVAGNTFTSATVVNRRVDNVLPTTSVTDPGSPLSGTLTVNATGTDPAPASGVANVKIQRSPAGADTWTDICTDNVAAYSCSWNTTTLSDALYDLRSIATDVAGNAATSTVVANRRVDNFVPSAADVQTANVGGTAGVINAGDTLTLTYSEEIDPTSILPGWDGTGSQNIYVSITHNNNGDRMLFYEFVSPYAQIPLAQNNGVDLKADYVPSGGATLAATLTRSASGTSFTVTMGAVVGGSLRTSAPPAATMVWSPMAGAKDLLGKACSTTARNETGAADVEF